MFIAEPESNLQVYKYIGVKFQFETFQIGIDTNNFN